MIELASFLLRRGIILQKNNFESLATQANGKFLREDYTILLKVKGLGFNAI